MELRIGKNDLDWTRHRVKYNVGGGGDGKVTSYSSWSVVIYTNVTHLNWGKKNKILWSIYSTNILI